MLRVGTLLSPCSREGGSSLCCCDFCPGCDFSEQFQKLFPEFDVFRLFQTSEVCPHCPYPLVVRSLNVGLCFLEPSSSYGGSLSPRV